MAVGAAVGAAVGPPAGAGSLAIVADVEEDEDDDDANWLLLSIPLGGNGDGDRDDDDVAVLPAGAPVFLALPFGDPLLITVLDEDEEDEDEADEDDAVGDATPPSASPSSSNILNMEEKADFDAGALGRAAAAGAGLDAASVDGELEVVDDAAR